MTNNRRANKVPKLQNCARRTKGAGDIPKDDPRRSFMPRRCKQGNESGKGNGGHPPRWSQAPAAK